jgi:type I protein arginine methyltransferase
MNTFFLKIFKPAYSFWRNFRQNNPKIEAFLYSLDNKKSFAKISQHERMLADTVRMDNYFGAIQKHVTPGDTVVDLGTGTGILAFFAAQKQPKKVYAIDHGEVLQFAEKLAEANDLKNVEFVRAHSSTFTPPEKVDVILHEQIGDYLINEDMVRNISDLRDRILKPGGKILPSLFEMYFEPIELNAGRRVSFLWEHNFNGIDYRPMKEWLESDKSTLSKPSLYNYIFPGDAKKWLSNPNPILSFDLMTVDPNNFPKTVNLQKEITEGGTFDGFALYFRIIFDEEHVIDNSPFEFPTHWFPSIFRIEPQKVEKGDVIVAELNMSDPAQEKLWDFKYEIKKSEPDAEKNQEFDEKTL